MGYYQIPLSEDSKERTAFGCHRGLYQFRVMPFDLSTAPGIFQEVANRVLEDCRDFAIAYLDDILILSKTKSDHLRHIESIFGKLREHNLKLKMKR